MEFFSRRQKLKPLYFERSLRFPISFIYFFIFLIVVFQSIYFNFGFSNLSHNQRIFLGSGFFIFLVLELIEWLIYPKKLHFLLAILFTALRFTFYCIITILDPTGIFSSMLGYIIYTLCFYISPIIVLPILLLVLFVFYQDINFFWVRQDIPISRVFELFSFIMFYLLGIIIRLDNRTRKQNQSIINQLEMYASNSISLGKQEERNRISRDLHDSLGHQLVSVNIQLQKAVAYREINADESLESINKAQQATNDAIKELRQSIKNLREFEEKSSFIEEIEKLIQHVHDNGLEINYELIGDSNGFPEFSLLTLKQIIQECLTNIEKHAKATQADLIIVFTRKNVVVKIKDNGIGFVQNKNENENHFGLLGIQERLEIISGKLKIISKPNTGAELIIELPKDIYGKIGD